MVKIRLRRIGRKNLPVYRLVVADSRSPRDGKFIEIIGQYAPRQKEGGLSRFLGVAISDERGRTREIREEHCYLFAFSFEDAPRREDLFR